jgi:polyisoprenoid-binding protein YceI
MRDQRYAPRQTAKCAGLVPALLLAFAPSAQADPAAYEIDREHATVGFLVSHLGFADVLGFFGEIDGRFVFDESANAVSDIEVSVGTASVFSNHEDRDEHLRSNDFLAARRFPEMTFRAPSAVSADGQAFEIAGTLELLGERRPLTLIATLNKSGDYPIGRNAYALGVSARGTLKRSDFGMSYGVDNGWVGDDVEIIIELEARRQ